MHNNAKYPFFKLFWNAVLKFGGWKQIMFWKTNFLITRLNRINAF